MCGIAGIFNFTGEPEALRPTLQIMNRSMIHRGPDEQGLHVDAGSRSGIAARRLSIMDLQNGSQPIFSEDGSVALVCNGEIYNHRALRRELEQKGYRLRSRSDCEVLVHLYVEEGVRFLERLNGMFALAVLDSRDGSVLLARDPVGMKHLYWAETPGGLAFASEARALFASGLVEPAPDWKAIGTYFSIGWVQSPSTAFKGLQRLQPGSFLQARGGHMRHGRYGEPVFENPPHERGLQEQGNELKALLEDAVASHLDADVPAGLFLSGGWDSSLVSLYASRRSGEPLNSYSLVFPDDPESDESRFSRQVAEMIGARGREIEVRDGDILDALVATSVALEEPVVTCPTTLGFLISRTAAQDRKLVLGGEGSDELFAGYGRFRYSPLHRLRSVVPHPLVPNSLPLPMSPRWARVLRFLSAPDEERAHLELNSSMVPAQTARLFHQDVPFATNSVAELSVTSPATRKSYRDALDLKLNVEFASRLPDGILFAHDKTSMAHSLEVRMPFLDRDVVRFAYRLPSGFKVRGDEMKAVLAPLAGELPPDVAQRRKLGLHVPPRIYQSGKLRRFYTDTILDTSRATGLFDHRRLEAWVGRRASGQHPRAQQLWPLCHFCLWWNNFIGPDRAPFIAAPQPGLADPRASG